MNDLRPLHDSDRLLDVLGARQALPSGQPDPLAEALADWAREVDGSTCTRTVRRAPRVRRRTFRGRGRIVAGGVLIASLVTGSSVAAALTGAQVPVLSPMGGALVDLLPEDLERPGHPSTAPASRRQPGPIPVTEPGADLPPPPPSTMGTSPGPAGATPSPTLVARSAAPPGTPSAPGRRGSLPSVALEPGTVQPAASVTTPRETWTPTGPRPPARTGHEHQPRPTVPSRPPAPSAPTVAPAPPSAPAAPTPSGPSVTPPAPPTAPGPPAAPPTPSGPPVPTGRPVTPPTPTDPPEPSPPPGPPAPSPPVAPPPRPAPPTDPP